MVNGYASSAAHSHLMPFTDQDCYAKFWGVSHYLQQHHNLLARGNGREVSKVVSKMIVSGSYSIILLLQSISIEMMTEGPYPHERCGTAMRSASPPLGDIALEVTLVSWKAQVFIDPSVDAFSTVLLQTSFLFPNFLHLLTHALLNSRLFC